MDMATRNTLPNGAEILARYHNIRAQNTWIVLCVWHEGPYREYVTWCTDGDGNAHWGHYFREYGAAARDYQTRVAESMG
jgi:hypothetical protein